MGASIAWHLATRGVRRVRVLERAPSQGAGSTGRATGGFRAQYDTEINVRLSLLSLEQLTRFYHDHGVDPEYQPVGYLFMARSEATLQTLRASLCVQHSAGYTDAHEIPADDIGRLSPAVDASRFLGGVYAPRDGYINPRAMLSGLLQSAARAGVAISYSSECVRLERASANAAQATGEHADRIVAVHTATERIATSYVVNAAGPWAAAVGAMAGVNVPVVPRRRHVALTMPTRALPEHTPMTICADTGFHARVRDDRVLLLSPHDPLPDDPFDTSVDDSWLNALHGLGQEMMPALAPVAIDAAGSWAGLYEQSPDGHMLFGATSEVPNLLLANGSSGHGVMHALAIGQLLAELVVDGQARTINMSSLAPDRFPRGAAIPNSALL